MGRCATAINQGPFRLFAFSPIQVMRRIVDDRWPIKYPPYMTDEARDLIARLLERKPVKRIGMLQASGRLAGCSRER
jgi:hypothetical protein